MNPVDIKSVPLGTVKVIYAEHQPEYLPLPVIKFEDGKVYSEWELTQEEILALKTGSRIRLWCMTFNHPLQPVSLEIVSN